MDELDIRLLQELQTDGRISVSQLSEKLNLSRPSVSDRIRKLQDQGVISSFKAVVSSAAVGRPISVIIQIGDLNLHHRKFEEIIAADPDIFEYYRVTGEACFFLKVSLASIDKLTNLVDRLSPYGTLRTSIVLSSSDSLRPMLPPNE